MVIVLNNAQEMGGGVPPITRLICGLILHQTQDPTVQVSLICPSFQSLAAVYQCSRMAEERGPGGVNLNVRLRTDARPEQLLKELLLSPLIYIRLLGIVSSEGLL